MIDSVASQNSVRSYIAAVGGSLFEFIFYVPQKISHDRSRVFVIVEHKVECGALL